MTSRILFSQFSEFLFPNSLREKVQDEKQRILVLENMALKLKKFSQAQVDLINEIVMDSNIGNSSFFLLSTIRLENSLLLMITKINDLVEKINILNKYLFQIAQNIDLPYDICIIHNYKEQINGITIQIHLIEDDLISIDLTLFVLTMTTIDLLTPVAKDRFNRASMLVNFEL